MITISKDRLTFLRIKCDTAKRTHWWTCCCADGWRKPVEFWRPVRTVGFWEFALGWMR